VGKASGVINDASKFSTMISCLHRRISPSRIVEDSFDYNKYVVAFSVFYNAKQRFERDISVLAIKAYGEHCLAVGRQKMRRK
jgi:tRNA G26 N,N-dimethylase Trm1